ncbi:MAG TPA: peptide chain release factor N(5)-glutamine methyltransferase [Candidatus Dormibacteraeota bacterium]|nr:peptide chain release factor N(5)-glutamine methyltransferase [Candidatus Dormibacteraeota bacterium]
MTVLEGIQRSSEFLAKHGVESPRLHSELLLAHVLKLQRMQLYLNFERAISETETDTLRGLVKRRSQREPLQHIIGSTSFCGLEIAVNRTVLIPRPETEVLAEHGWKFLNGTNKSQPTALDLGTGSGCIAIALANNSPQARVYALDTSIDSLSTAKQNAERNHVADRIEFIQSDLFGPSPRPDAPRLSRSTIPRVDLIISNPPYIPTAEIETLAPEVRDFDPRQALDGGPDGLDFYRRIAGEAHSHLEPGGKLMLELGDGQSESLQKLFAEQKWIVEGIVEDYTGRQRILIAHESGESDAVTQNASEQTN